MAEQTIRSLFRGGRRKNVPLKDDFVSVRGVHLTGVDRTDNFCKLERIFQILDRPTDFNPARLSYIAKTTLDIVLRVINHFSDTLIS